MLLIQRRQLFAPLDNVFVLVVPAVAEGKIFYDLFLRILYGI